MKRLIFIALLIFSVVLFGCKGEDGKDGVNGTNGVDGTDGTGTTETGPILTKYTPNGKLQKGPCPEGGEVLLLPLDNSNMKQSGEGPFIGFTIDDFGKYYVPMEIERDASDDVYVEVYFDGKCHHELNGGDEYQKFTGIINTDDAINNINPLTNVRSYVARWLFGDSDLTAIYGAPESGTEGSIELSLVLAESRIITFLGMPDPLKKFTEMNLENGDTGDAVLCLFNSLVLYMQDEGIYNDVLVKIGSAVIENDLAIKAEIAGKFPLIPVISVKNNLENRYLSLGLEINVPKIWNLGFHPDYYSDLLERTPVVLESANVDQTSQCNIDVSYHDSFAYPVSFADLESAKYFATELAGNLSLWSVGSCDNGVDIFSCPGTQLLTIEELRELLLPVANLSYNGLMGVHSLISGQFYLVQNLDTPGAPGHVCAGAMAPFGWNIATSGNDWVNAIGYNNVTPWFRRGIKWTTTD